MARLSKADLSYSSSEDELPDLHSLLGSMKEVKLSSKTRQETSSRPKKQDQNKDDRRKEQNSDSILMTGQINKQDGSHREILRGRTDVECPGSIVVPFIPTHAMSPVAPNSQPWSRQPQKGCRSSPRRHDQKRVDYRKFVSRLSDSSISLSEDDDSFTDLSGFIVPDSQSDEEVIPGSCPRRKNLKHHKIASARSLIDDTSDQHCKSARSRIPEESTRGTRARGPELESSFGSLTLSVETCSFAPLKLLMVCIAHLQRL